MNNLEPQETLSTLSRILKTQARILIGFVLFIWLLEILDFMLFGGALDRLGVQPRALIGLRGIVLMPFLHSGFSHLLANTFPFVVLGWLVMVRRTADFWLVSAIVILASGAGVWLLGASNSVHIGASGLVFGYFGYLLLRGYFERSAASIFLAVIVIVLYGGLLFGVLPLQPGVSWQAHLFGFLGGVWAAYLIVKG